MSCGFRCLRKCSVVLLSVSLWGFGAVGVGRAADIDWVEVGAPGNACDVQAQGCFGAVFDVFRISRYEVTIDQYVEFLNAVASTDTHSLYTDDMSTGLFGCIDRSGAPGSFVYTAKSGRGDMPVAYVSWFDVLRFANWLHNGQPAGAQDSTSTEDGAYTFSDETTVGPRNVGARVFLPTEDEWYKAAYYDPDGMAYFDYPADSDALTACAVPGATPNTANCASIAGDLTDVGSYTGAPSPNGSFDQGGNLFEWSETINSTSRVVRGGSFGGAQSSLAASFRGGATPEVEGFGVGFRVAAPATPFPHGIPAMGTFALLSLGSVLGISARRRLRKPVSRPPSSNPSRFGPSSADGKPV